MVKNSTRSMEVIKACNSRRDDCTLLLCRSTEVSVSKGKGIVTHIGPFELVRISLDNNRQVTQKSQKSFPRHVMEKKFWIWRISICHQRVFLHILLVLSWENINQRKSCRRRGTFLGQFLREWPLLWPFVTLSKSFFVAVHTKTT